MNRIFFICVFLPWGCEDDTLLTTVMDKDGVVVAKPFLWKTNIGDDDYKGSLISNEFISYDGNMLVGGWKDGEPVIYAVDEESGSIEWSWKDFLDPEWELWSAGFYQHDNLLVHHEGRRGYCIDLNNGRTVWKNRYEVPSTHLIAGLGNIYFIPKPRNYPNGFHYEIDVYMGDLLAGPDKKKVLTPNYERREVALNQHGLVGNICSIVPYLEGSDTVLLINYADLWYEGRDFVGTDYLGAYNLTQGKWLYEKKPSCHRSALHNGRLYSATGGLILCHDMETGGIIWEASFPHGFGSPFLIVEEEGKLLTNCEDTYLYALDLHTGAQEYKVKSSGSCGAMSYLNGIVYYVGGGDGLLHAVEVSTGRHLWKIKSPDVDKYSGAFFLPQALGAFPGGSDGRGPANGHGWVVLSTTLNTYAYQAAR